MADFPNRHASEEEAQASIDKSWQEFWRPIFLKSEDVTESDIKDFEGDEGFVSPMFEAVKRELSDIHMLTHNLSCIYDEITGGKVSKPNTDWREVSRIANDYQNELFREDAVDFIESLDNLESLSGEDVVELFKDWFL